MTPDELADYERWVADERARVAAHQPPTTAADHAFLEQLGRELDAAPHLQDYFRQLEPPYPLPMPDDDVQDAAQRAIEDLAGQRRMAWLGDGAVQVHLIASLISDLQFRLDEAIVLAADQQVELADIARLAGLSVAETRQTIANIDPENDLAH
jgi:hypothetical protein